MEDNHSCSGGWCGTDSRLRSILAVVGVLLALFLLAKALHEFKLFGIEGKYMYPSNTVAVTGIGEVTAIPNVASFTYTVLEEGATVGDAQKKATEKGNKAIDFLKSEGIEEKDIKTVGYNISPKYEYTQGPCNAFGCPPGRQVLKGYEVSQNIAVKVRKTEDAGDILAGIGTLNVSYVSGLEFTVDDEESLKAEARTKAIADAQEKVKALAKDLNVKIVKVVNFYEEGDQYPIPYASERSMVGNADMKLQAAVAPDLPGGENKVKSRVMITYEIK